MISQPQERPGQLRKYKIKTMVFLKKVQNSSGELVCLVRLKNAVRDIWHYVLLEKLKRSLFEQAMKTDYIDVAKYGKILHSGWGKNPPDEIVEAVKKQYS